MQEEEYYFPYHYLNILSLFQDIEYVSYLKIVKSLISPIKSKKILDFGCGDGRFEYELRAENADILGIDLSSKALSFARAFNPSINFLAEDINNFSSKSKFDYIVSIETFEHLPPQIIKKIVSSLAKLLKSDGKLIITVPSDNMPVADKHYQHFNEPKLSSFVKEHFVLDKAIGQHKMGFLSQMFRIMNFFGRFLELFLKNKAPVRLYARLVSRFYKRNVEIGPLNKTKRLIAVYRKK